MGIYGGSFGRGGSTGGNAVTTIYNGREHGKLSIHIYTPVLVSYLYMVNLRVTYEIYI